MGTLETIDASHAYWVMSNNSDPMTEFSASMSCGGILSVVTGIAF